MKGLIRSIFILVAIIVVGIVASIIMTSNLNRKVAGAQGYGVEEGRAQGYEAGFQRGSIAGYQEGSKTGYARSRENPTTNSYGAGFYFSYNPTDDEVDVVVGERYWRSAYGVSLLYYDDTVVEIQVLW